MTIKTLPDITGVGAGSVTQLTTIPTRCRWVQFSSVTAAGARVGDSSVGANQGLRIITNTIVMLRASDTDVTDFIDLSTIYVWATSSLTISVAYGI